MPPARALRPVNPDNARLLRITAAAGTSLAEAYSSGTVVSLFRVHVSAGKRGLHPTGLLPSRGVAPSGFRPLWNIPYCCVPWGSQRCLRPSVADRALRPATDRRHGRLLPHHLAGPP